MTPQRDSRRSVLEKIRFARLRQRRAVGVVAEQLERRALLSAGQVDTTFGGGDGKVALNLPSGGTFNFTSPPMPVSVAVGPDDRTLIAENLLVNGKSQISVQRLNADGTLDTSFGSAGRVTISNATATRILLANSGKIYVAGSIIARLNNDGSFDATFGGGDGKVTSPTLVRGIVVMHDDEINLVGLTGGAGSSSAVYELNPDGSADPTFGVGGKRVLTFPDGSGGTISPVAGGLALDSLERLLVAVTIKPGQSGSAFGVARVTSAGNIDTSFGTSGLGQIAAANAATGASIALANSGTIYVAGTTNLSTSSRRGSLAAFSANGKLSSRVATGVASGSAAFDVQVQTDNKPVVTGSQLSSGNNKVIVQRFNAVSSTNPTTPVLDTSFNGTGTVQVDYTGGGSGEATLGNGDSGWAVRLSPDAKIVVAGTIVEGSTKQASVTRLQADTATAASFGTISGTVFYDLNGDGVRQAVDVALPNAGVFLDKNNNGVFDFGDVRTFSDANGNYKFFGLKGTVHLQQHPTGGLRNTRPTNGKYTITVGAGQNITGKDYAIGASGTISGTIFEDLNGDGVRQSNEAPFPGAGCFIDFNNNGVFDSGIDERVLAGSNGVYTFSNLAAGIFRIRQSAVPGWERTVPATLPYVVTLGLNQAVTGKDFALHLISAGSHRDANGTLVISGSDNADTISIDHNELVGGSTINITINGVSQSYAASSINRIYLDARGGNDTITESGTDNRVGADGGLGVPSTLLGGSGNDTINQMANDATNARGPSDSVDGGDGNDTIFCDANGNVTLHGGNGDDSINNRPTFNNNATIFGDAGNDTIFYFTNAAMVISGGSGIDLLDTGTNILLGNVSVSLDGVANDGVAGLAQSNVQADIENLRIIAHQGNLTVTGDDDDNQITASNDNSVVVNGLGGNDSLSGSGSAVTINGGDGNDSVTGSGASVLFSGGNGTDLLDLSSRTANNTIILDGSSNGGQTGEVDHVDGTIEQARGGSGNDNIVGTSGNNTLSGGGGNDTITSNGGADSLLGGDGNDTFFAKDGGTDFIDGGNGVDQGQTDVGDTTVNVEVVTH